MQKTSTPYSEKKRLNFHNMNISEMATTPIHNIKDIDQVDFIKNFMLQLHNIAKPTKLRTAIEKGNRPQLQCQASIGAPEFLKNHDGTPLLGGKVQNTHCWLCGHPLISIPYGTHCEHKLPILNATFFTGVFNHKFKTAEENKEYRINMEKLQKMSHTNYAWSHGWCNTSKQDLMPIKYSTDLGRAIIDETVCNTLASRIIEIVEKKRAAQIKNTYAKKLPADEYKDKLLAHYRTVLGEVLKHINREVDSYVDEYRDAKGAGFTSIDEANARRDYVESALYLSHLYFYQFSDENKAHPIPKSEFIDKYNAYTKAISWKYSLLPPPPEKETGKRRITSSDRSVRKVQKIINFNTPKENQLHEPQSSQTTRRRRSSQSRSIKSSPHGDFIDRLVGSNKSSRRSSRRSLYSSKLTPSDI